MDKRKYADIKKVELQILQMRADGKSKKQIANELGLQTIQIKNWINRYNRKQTLPANERITKKKGRPKKVSLSEEQTIKQLQMENELLKNFLLLVGRM